ncbi:SAM-dependent methyltransferase [Neisseria sp. Ec49-e6-T10]|uniref:SAM-dependent methyltransferase n=1 Tax=Neisseria sp. Ec49-e6-T10 TaxID=3140744 RepID=UPI003EBBC425
MNYGSLWLIPAPLGDENTPWLLEHERLAIVAIKYFIVEAEKTARKHLKALGVTSPIRDLDLQLLNEHNQSDDLSKLIQPLLQGLDVGLISEAGCPAVADPGANLVALAHTKGIEIKPLVGPSSILMALMASGANGQRFTFNGYLPADTLGRKQALKDLEKKSQLSNETQIFIETPYRNMSLIEDALQSLNKQTRFCIACDLTLPTQKIISKPVGQWPKDIPNLHKKPCIFILHHE